MPQNTANRMLLRKALIERHYEVLNTLSMIREILMDLADTWGSFLQSKHTPHKQIFFDDANATVHTWMIYTLQCARCKEVVEEPTWGDTFSLYGIDR